jgi:hypothetical protein
MRRSVEPPLRGEISPNPGSRFEPQNRSRRGEEAEAFAGRGNPPPHVGGYRSESVRRSAEPPLRG